MAKRIALFGQAPVASSCLDELVARGHQVVGVFAPPDTGRPDPLADRATALGLPLFRRRFFQKKDGSPIAGALEEYRALDAELNVLASLTSFLPSAITDAPTFGSICFHPSLLPRYRGGNAMQWQIIDGEPEVGVTIFVPDAGVDTGPIVVQRGGVAIGPNDTTASLFFDKLAPLGVEALVEAVTLIDKGESRGFAQDESRATFQGLVDDDAAGVDLDQPAQVIDRLVRGCDPQPGAYLRHDGLKLRLFGATLCDARGAPGEIVAIDDAGLTIALQDGALRVARVRADAGKEAAHVFAARAGLAVGDRLDGA